MSGGAVSFVDWVDDDEDDEETDLDGSQIGLDADIAAEDPNLDWTPNEGDDEGDALPPPPTPAQSMVDDPEFGHSVNLVPHSSFESARDWSVGPGWTVPFPWSAFHGSCVARFTGAAGGELVSAAIPVDEETTYWVSAMSWMDAWTSGTGQLLVRQYADLAGTDLLDEAPLAKVTGLSQGWTRLTGRVVGKASRDTDVVMGPLTQTVRLALSAGGNAVMTWMVDGIQLEMGMASIYAPAPGEDMEGSEILPGTLPASTFDTTPPAVPVITSVTSAATMDADGKPVVLLTGTVADLPTDEDYAGIEMTATRSFVLADPDDSNSARSPDWSQRVFDFLPPGDHVGTLPVIARTDYWVRACSIDTQGNRSAYSTTVEYLTVSDGEAPGIPQGLFAGGAFKSIIVSWNKSTAEDLSTYEVRWRKTIDKGLTVVNPWSVAVRTRNTVFTVAPLDATMNNAVPPVEDTTYEVAVRAIDTSGQVQTSALTPIAVLAVDDPDAGWSVPVAAQPKLVGGGDIVANSILASHIRAGEITTDKLGAGEIVLNTTTDNLHPDGIVIMGTAPNAGELARWDETGLTIWTDGTNDGHKRYVRMTGGEITMVGANGTQSAITPDGIDASALRFGSAPGGHNLVFNSSFELVGAIAAPLTITDTVAADWTGTQVGSPSNLTAGAAALSITSVAF